MIITRAPMRISFFGGGTDFPEYFLDHGGAVLSTAIDKYSYVTASHFHSRLFDYAVRISYSQGEMVKDVGGIRHNVFRECLRLCGLEKDVELHTVADLPSFTGLGASSSFTVALLLALHAFKREHVSGLELAYEAIHVERQILKECVGLQDQAIAAIGGFNVFEFRAEDNIVVHPVDLSPRRLNELESHLLLVFTGIKRRAIEVESAKVAGFNARQTTLRAMRQMVDDGVSCLTSTGSLEPFGRLLHEAWTAKQNLSDAVSNPEIQALYDTGMGCGAWGGKLLGAGGGGFLQLFADPASQADVRKRLHKLPYVPFQFESLGSQIVFLEREDY